MWWWRSQVFSPRVRGFCSSSISSCVCCWNGRFLIFQWNQSQVVQDFLQSFAFFCLSRPRKRIATKTTCIIVRFQTLQNWSSFFSCLKVLENPVPVWWEQSDHQFCLMNEKSFKNKKQTNSATIPTLNCFVKQLNLLLIFNSLVTNHIITELCCEVCNSKNTTFNTHFNVLQQTSSTSSEYRKLEHRAHVRTRKWKYVTFNLFTLNSQETLDRFLVSRTV